MATATENLPELALGDRVRIRNYSGPPGRIIELRGPLGPDGADIYRVAIPMEPGFIQIEVRSDQLERIVTLPKKLVGRPSIGVQKAIKEVKQTNLSLSRRLVARKRTRKLGTVSKSVRRIEM